MLAVFALAVLVGASHSHTVPTGGIGTAAVATSAPEVSSVPVSANGPANTYQASSDSLSPSDPTPAPTHAATAMAGTEGSTAAAGQAPVVVNPKEVVTGQPAHPNAPPNTDVFVAQGTYEATAGKPLTISANFQVGFTGVPVAYSWSGCPEVAGQTGQAITVTFATPGTYDVYVTATQVVDGYTFNFKSSVPAKVVVS